MSGMKIHITGVSGNIVQVGWAGADPSCVLLSPLRFIWQFLFFFCSNVSLFELMLGVPVNSYGHVGTLPPFYWTYMYTQN